jgi:WS/DGAT C-terminal domain
VICSAGEANAEMGLSCVLRSRSGHVAAARAGCSSLGCRLACQTTPSGSRSSCKPPGKGHPDQGVAGIVALPASLARLGVAWAKRSAAAHINLYVTNVPGPTSTLYFAGARLLQAVPLAPLVAGVRLSVTALSYDGQFGMSLLVDDNVPDLPVLAAGVRGAFDCYVNAVARSTGA